MRKILENSFLSILILPLSLFYFIYTAYNYYIEHKRFKKVINKNEAFTMALMTLDFKGHKYLPSYFYCEKDVDENLSLVEVQDIAQKQVIQVILKYLKTEDMLSILTVDTEVHDGKVLFSIQPASLQITILNAWNLIKSIMLYLILTFLYFKFM
ncbi:hypothetical protein HYO65_gp043 [Tenacibaculum phage PTm1]|uniref:Uncharacterized protein n=2 Tax=Shirahamavirus PTm1 TaxID=2846435 RepID=A0A5S9EQG8_9CAUD|nr:hypothetical protein HYO65_gp043 [Tenacibaculum phage PTm1]BBI90435.1 hypothetical protein [Tenacibaculum phage PTm1]BBI90742.1 hypothetical protein [Tenacibaculum phage PTm5]